MTPEQLAEASTRGPRYTSYPPATELRPVAAGFTAVDVRGPVSLYAHIPFCKQLCWYCGCNVVPTRDVSRGDRYVDALVTELAMVASRSGGLTANELALGGGSPNFLSPGAMNRLMAAVRRYAPLLPGARLSVELDPRDTSALQIGLFAALGFRAMSVGVQDFAGPVQEAIHRHQSRRQTEALIANARTQGFTDVNVDMVYGLPRQTETSFAETLDAVIALAPDRIALFGYAHLPDRLPHQRLVERAGRVLDSYERASLLLLAIDKLGAVGYLHLGLDHFARPDSALARAWAERRLARTFQGYVERRAETILGIGASAISSTPDRFWQNHVALDAWERAIVAGELPVARGFALDRDDQIRRAVIEQLMCYGEVHFDAIEVAYGISAPLYFADELASLDDLAWYDADTNAVFSTPTGRLLVRNTCMRFDRYIAAGSNRFSATI